MTRQRLTPSHGESCSTLTDAAARELQNGHQRAGDGGPAAPVAVGRFVGDHRREGAQFAFCWSRGQQRLDPLERLCHSPDSKRPNVLGLGRPVGHAQQRQAGAQQVGLDDAQRITGLEAWIRLAHRLDVDLGLEPLAGTVRHWVRFRDVVGEAADQARSARCSVP